jgi:hypothetical protein
MTPHTHTRLRPAIENILDENAKTDTRQRRRAFSLETRGRPVASIPTASTGCQELFRTPDW